jgi:hypothetical protein
MTTAAILQLALQLLPLITTGVPEFIKWIESLKSTLQQAGEWTPELDTAYRAALWAHNQDPAFQPDPH